MSVGWFFAPLERWRDPDRPALVAVRHAVYRDFQAQVKGDGGDFREIEVLGGQVIVKVRASAATLAAIAAAPGVVRLPKDRLDDSLNTLTGPQKTAISNKLQSLGYSLAEINARFTGDLGQYTLRDVLDFARSRRRRPRYDQPSDTVIWNAAIEIPEPLSVADDTVADG